MISFDPMKNFMKENGITQYQLLKNGILLPAHVTRLSYNHNFTLKFIDMLCRELNCQPSDLIKYIDSIDNKEKLMTNHRLHTTPYITQ